MRGERGNKGARVGARGRDTESDRQKGGSDPPINLYHFKVINRCPWIRVLYCALRIYPVVLCAVQCSLACSCAHIPTTMRATDAPFAERTERGRGNYCSVGLLFSSWLPLVYFIYIKNSLNRASEARMASSSSPFPAASFPPNVQPGRPKLVSLLSFPPRCPYLPVSACLFLLVSSSISIFPKIGLLRRVTSSFCFFVLVG